MVPLALSALVLARLDAGRGEQAEADIAAHGYAREIPAAGVFAGLQHARGRVHAARGRPEHAGADYLAAGRSLLNAGVTTPAIVPWRSDAAVALAATGEHRRARALADEELSLARRLGAPRPLGLALRASGLIAAVRDRVPLLLAAAEQLHVARCPTERARVLTELGMAELRCGRRDAGREHLREALDLADRTGARALADRAHQELLVAGARPRRRRLSGREALTAAELRVARLAAHGRSNREIAGELFLAPKTVETHLRHAYAKLSITSRRQLADALGN